MSTWTITEAITDTNEQWQDEIDGTLEDVWQYASAAISEISVIPADAQGYGDDQHPAPWYGTCHSTTPTTWEVEYWVADEHGNTDNARRVRSTITFEPVEA